MIQKLPQKLGHFRSELLMSRYQKSKQTGNQILREIKLLKKIGINTKELNELQVYVEQQLALSNMLYCITGQIPLTTSINIKNSHALIQSHSNFVNKNYQQQSVKNEQVSNYGMIHQSQEVPKDVGKWGAKKKRTKIQKQTPTDNQPSTKNQHTNNKQQQLNRLHSVQPGSDEHISQIVLAGEQQMVIKLTIKQSQIIQRELILPLTVPQFFRNTEPRRLIICYYGKCADVIDKISKELIIDGEIIQMESIRQCHEVARNKQQSGGKQKQGYKLYVCPLCSDQRQMTQIIFGIVKPTRNILVLYCQKDRIVMTEKPSSFANNNYQLIF